MYQLLSELNHFLIKMTSLLQVHLPSVLTDGPRRDKK